MKSKPRHRIAQKPRCLSAEKRGRDNKDYRNASGWCCGGYTVRVPSLKRNAKVWQNFYELFPYIKAALMNNEFVHRFGQPTLVGDIYICKDKRVHSGVGRRVRTTKFLKCW